MLNLENYHVSEPIYESFNTLVYRGVRLDDQKPVILKLLKRDYPSEIELAEFKNEYVILSRLNLSGVIKVYGIEEFQNTLVIVMEDFLGYGLKKFPVSLMSMEVFLPVAINLTKAVAEIHAENIIHKNINPSNIVVNLETNELKLIDFGVAGTLKSESQSLKNPETIEGNAAYFSPEQTGRINRSIDYRTDLYSMGLTFYELLTGDLPFNASNAMEFVHGHIAKKPTPISKNNPHVPAILSDIVMKLLSKNAEDRYQSALGLKNDLEECLRQLNNKGQIETFPLASEDFSYRLQIPQKLYGRRDEVAKVLDAFARVSQGSAELLLISGYSGVGKTALVQEVYRPMTKRKGYYCSGKFDQYQRNIPYYAITQAFNNFCDYLLTESPENLARWKTKILQAVGDNGKVITDIIPNLESVIGIQPEVTKLSSTEAQNRFNLLFQNFFKAIGNSEHPFVLFIDDLQWADSASLNLLTTLFNSHQGGYFLIIAAYRDNEVQKGQPFAIMLEQLDSLSITNNRLHVKNLEYDDVAELVLDSLKSEYEEAQPVVELIYEKTRGNAFFTHQFLTELYEDNLLFFDIKKKGWSWKLEKLQQKEATDNVIDLMTHKIKRLSKETRELLQIASCIGNQFDIRTLALLMQQDASLIIQKIWPAIEEKLIVSLNQNHRFLLESSAAALGVNLRFIHERVQQAGYGLIRETDLKPIHLKIGRLLLANKKGEEIDEQIFEVTRHLNLGRELISDTPELNELAVLNLHAGHRAKASAAYQDALFFFQQAMISDMRWSSDYDFKLEVYENAAETAFLCNQQQALEDYTDEVLKAAKNETDRVEVYRLLIQKLNARGECGKSIELGLEVLDKLGYSIQAVDSFDEAVEQMERFNQKMEAVSLSKFINLPKMDDKTALKAAEIMVSLLPSTFIVSRMDICIMLLIHSLKLYSQLGNAPVAPFAYGLYGGFNFIFLNRIKLSQRYAEITLHLLADDFYSRNRSRGLHMVGLFIYPWIKPLVESIELLLQGVQTGKDLGDKEFACYNADTYALISLWAGLPLDKVYERNKSMLEFTLSQHMQTSENRLRAYQEVLHNLRHEVAFPYQLSGKYFNEHRQIPQLTEAAEKSGLSYIYANKLFLAYLFGHYAQCKSLAILQEQYEMAGVGVYTFAGGQFYRALSYLAESEIDEETFQKLEKIRSNMKFWASSAPENFQHKLDLIDAELARYNDNPWQAVKLYEKAIQGARENHFIQEEALANERFADFWLAQENQLVATTYLQQSLYVYSQWGASAKVKQLDEKYSQFLNKIDSLAPFNSEAKDQQASFQFSKTKPLQLDLGSVIKASQALSENIVFDELLKNMMLIVMENAGAQSGKLLLKRNEHWYIEAKAKSKKNKVKVLRSIRFEKTKQLPHSIINYVIRSGESVVLSNAYSDGPYTHDPYIKEHYSKSVLCLPLINHGEVSAILYLENNLISGAFTQERLEVLNLLSSQMIISMENSFLYNELEQKVEERTEALKQSLETLTKTQTHLIETEKMASLGRLVAGVAHEINTPIGLCVTGTTYLQEKILSLSKRVEDGVVRKGSFEEYVDASLETIEILLTNLDRALSLIQNFKQVSVDVSSEMIRPFKLLDYINTTVQSLQPELKQSDHKIEIKGDKEIEVKSLPGAISQIVTNLLINSHYHAFPQGQTGHIIIEATVSNDEVKMLYSDNGIGMSEKIQAEMFEPFFTTRRDLGGSGLGMFIVYNLVSQTLKGKIKLSSKLGEGTRFEIRFPKDMDYENGSENEK